VGSRPPKLSPPLAAGRRSRGVRRVAGADAGAGRGRDTGEYAVAGLGPRPRSSQHPSRRRRAREPCEERGHEHAPGRRPWSWQAPMAKGAAPREAVRVPPDRAAATVDDFRAASRSGVRQGQAQAPERTMHPARCFAGERADAGRVVPGRPRRRPAEKAPVGGKHADDR